MYYTLSSINKKNYLIIICFLQMMFILNSASAIDEEKNIKFQVLQYEDGISNLDIQSIEQDTLGYIWIATSRGLNRYDGIRFKHYFFSDSEDHLYHDLILNLHRNYEGKIFCSTSYGINLMDPSTEKISRIQCNNELFTDFTDLGKNTYGSSFMGGLFLFKPEEMAFKQITSIPENIVINQLLSLNDSSIIGLAINDGLIIKYNPFQGSTQTFPVTRSMKGYTQLGMVYTDNFLIYGWEGVHFFDLEKEISCDIPEKWSELRKLNSLEITFIKELQKDILWIGSIDQGVYVFNLKNNQLFNLNSTNSNIGSNHIVTGFTDKNKNLWLGTFDQGIAVTFKERNNFNFNSKLSNLTQNIFITSIATNSRGTLFLGTRLNGILIYDKSSSPITRRLNTYNSFLTDNHVRCLLCDSRNQLWIGTENSLEKSQSTLKDAITIDIPPPNKGVVSFCEQDEKIFASTDYQGFFILDYEGKLLKQETAAGFNITQVIPYKNHKILLSSYGKGLFSYDIESGTFENLNHKIPNKKILQEMITLYLDPEGILWIGNFKYGLFRLDLRHDDFKVFNTESGLPGNDVVTITEDNQGFLWLGTSYGLSRFNKKDHFVNYFKNEGLNNIQFHQKAILSDKEGIIYIGGNYGLTFFNPTNLSGTEQKQPPKIILEKLNLSNQEIQPGDNTGILSKALSATSKITLKHNQNILTIEYHSFDFIAANKIKYAYMLNGFDEDWHYVGTRKFANYANLNPGTYTFIVKAQNNTGIWSEPASLKIIIKPSPFLTPLAWSVYILIVSLIVFFSFRITLKTKLYKNQLELEHRDRIRENEIAQMKMRFFTNISHEIRTPLTLIRGNLELLARDLDEKNLGFESMKGLQYSTQRLLRLINQLLSFRKLESDALNLSLQQKDIISISRKLCQSFYYVASARNIEIEFHSNFKKLITPLDEDKFEKILSNLLSNSLKYSYENGFIEIVIDLIEKEKLKKFFPDETPVSDKKYIRIAVKDNGSGIPERDIASIFDRFQQSKSNSGQPDHSGTGIGLNFTKRLVELHNGRIIVSSIPSKETVFSFILPLNYEDVSIPSIQSVTEQVPETMIKNLPESIHSADTDNEKKSVILIIEDDIVLNRLIKNYLDKKYTIYSGYDGEEGLSLAEKHLPDLIISDIMMPKINGFQLCEKIRGHEIISHTPIILLTAKADTESRITGFEYGADDYLSKPFELRVLDARVQNLIRLRKNLQVSFRKGRFTHDQKNITNICQQEFIDKVQSQIAENYQDSDFNVHQLSEKMNMSRAGFYRKFMSIMDVSPRDFLTKYRLNKAIEMIESGNSSVGEISFLCGFGTQSNFTVLFKKEQGTTPLQYKKALMK